MFLAAVANAPAQEAVNTKAATQPATGVLAYREQFRFTTYGRDPLGFGRRVQEWTARTMLTYGLRGNLALDLQVPVAYRRSRFEDAWSDKFNLDDVQFTLKDRVWQLDSGPTDTARLSLLAGVDVPAGTVAFSGSGISPMAGAAFTQVHGRHGWNLAMQYTLTTAGSLLPVRPGSRTADLLQLDAAYLYRFIPAEYSLEQPDAWYAVLEANTAYETNGDIETLLAPGIMFEGTHLALELSVQLPVARRIDHRLAREVSVAAGFRLLF